MPRFAVGLFRPTVDVQHLLGLLHLKLEREPLAGPVTGIEVAALETGPMVHWQMPLFAADAADRNDQPGVAAWTQLIERLSSRLGRPAVMSVRLLPDAQPEHAWRGEPFLGDLRRKRGGKTLAGELPPRPLMMFAQPVALQNMPVVHDPGEQPPGHIAKRDPATLPLARIQFDGDEHRLIGGWGPERIETGWWRGRQIARDYYRVETAAGRHLWLFRRLDTGRWFAHGVFE